MNSLLSIDNLSVHYGQVEALKGISLEVKQGEIVTILGANGAGKSTTLNAISGLVAVSGGKITFAHRNINSDAAHSIVEMGIAQVPEGRQVFATLTVEENLNLGGYVHRGNTMTVASTRREVFELFPRLAERKYQLAGTLSGGEQQMLAIGRALMAKPRLLLLDEPSLGLAPMLVGTIFKKIRAINEQGVTVVLVEQNANLALRLADRGYVLETGRVVLSGETQELLTNQQVRKAYLGG